MPDGQGRFPGSGGDMTAGLEDEDVPAGYRPMGGRIALKAPGRQLGPRRGRLSA